MFKLLVLALGILLSPVLALAEDSPQPTQPPPISVPLELGGRIEVSGGARDLLAQHMRECEVDNV
jgi:hypothetical protein